MKNPKPTLKKLLLLFTPIALAAALIGSCKKDNHSTTQTKTAPPAVAQAKEWYQKTYPAGTKLATQSVLDGTDWSQGIVPDWDNSASYTRFDDDVIEMPVDAAVSGKLTLGLKEETTGQEYNSAYSKSSFLLIKKLGTYHAYIMTIIADPAYLKGDLTRLDRNKYNKRDTDFTGVVLYSTPKGVFVNAWTYSNGKITGKIPPAAESPDGADNGVKTEAIKTNLTAITTCYTWTQTLTYGGYTNPPVVLDSYCVTTYSGSIDVGSGGGGGGSAPGGGGGGGGSATPANPAKPPVPKDDPCAPKGSAVSSVGGTPAVNSLTVNVVQPPATPVDPGGGFPPPDGTVPCASVITPHTVTTVVTNNVTDPCLKKMVDATINANITTVVNTLIQKVFNSSSKVNINFIDVTNLPAGVDGAAPPPNSLDPNGNLTITVQLNKNELPNYSQEYIAATIIHESLHAYLTTTQNLGAWQHTIIASTFVNQMSLDLRQMFPGLKETDATNLAWGGLEATDGFQQTIAKDAVKQGSYQATNLAYSKGISGSRCK